MADDAMRWTPETGPRPVLDPCPGYCHELGDDDCLRCCSGDAAVACDDCRFYMAQDAEVSRG